MQGHTDISGSPHTDTSVRRCRTAPWQHFSCRVTFQQCQPFPGAGACSPGHSCPRWLLWSRKVLTAGQGSSAGLCCCSPAHTHTLGTSPSLGILWPAVEWALCSRTRVLALALNPLQFLAQLSLSPRGFTLGWREGQPDP